MKIQPIVITSKSGLVFKMHPILGESLTDFMVDPETGKFVPALFPVDIADSDPIRAVEWAKEQGYRLDESGAWCDPLLDLAKTT